MIYGQSAGDSLISKSKLEHLYLESKLSDVQIGKIYGISGGRVHRLRNRYNIQAIEYYQRHHKQVLDTKEKEFLVGTLLGDGHLRWRNKKDKRAYPQLILEQSIIHREYAFWLKNQIKDWLYDPNKPLKQVRKVTRGKTYHSYPFQTICHPVFIEFYEGFYKNRIKTVSIDILEKFFTPFSLAVWLMDDGTISKNRNIALCSQSFTKEENNNLSEFLLNRFDLKNNLWKSSNKYYLGFSKEASIKIADMVKDFIIPSMKHKLISPETTKEAKLTL